ncbi:uncharacterized protein PAC_19304 [Phialocephala subalpina]|uniref:Uncharacterized protein n=1 Tax=Phialocephala subalpina TaxID=576137 RepID=A0A1L7XWI9_9HELO|nr:uncharacterized protein PAC_19304 [Phialocephala subalpina]
MDPLSALSIAGTVAQFVDFGNKLLTSSIQLYKSSRGSLKVHEELELITGDLQSVLFKLRGARSANSSDVGPSVVGDDHQFQDSFRKLCDEATLIAEELLDKLNSLRVKDGKRPRWESLKVAVRSAWSKDEISALKTRLFTLREALHSRSILSIEEKIDATSIKLSSRFDSLDAQAQQLLEAITNTSEGFSIEVLDSLAALIRRSERVNEDEHHRTRQMIADLRNDLSSQSSPMEVITAQVEMLNVGSREEQDLRISVNKQILEELSYPGMTNRYEDIVEAHSKTFDWIFSDAKKSNLPWSDFGTWLRDDSDIYWINGKAGSGKSTLMKHIYDDAKTKKNLQLWINKNRMESFRCCLATFFFWNSGTKLQQSQQGLLRSLLFQILSQHTSLIPIVFPTRWAELYGRVALDITQRIVPKTWSLRQLHVALETLMDQKQYPLKLCFLIDGLDEFSGDPEQLCLFFKRLNERSDKAKFCLSSRPWVQFKQNFHGSASLRLQDLTSNDISKYVNDMFHQSPAFMRLAARDVELTSSLAREVLERADGVFLWVEIVVRHLLKGINNSDTIPELWSRLRSFPRELYPLYNVILSQIEPLYQEWASRTFQIMRVSLKLSSDPFEKMSLSRELNKSENVEDPGVGPLTLIGLLLAMDENCTSGSLAQIPPYEISKLCEETSVRLTARCAGLLEVNTQPMQTPGGFRIYPIRWMHRTARDFIEQDEKWTKDLSPPGFSPYFSMMRSCILCLTEIYSSLWERGHAHAAASITIKDAMIYAYHANGDSRSRRVRTGLLKSLMHVQSVPRDPSEALPAAETFLHWATMYCLSDFVEDILSAKQRTIQLQTSTILLRHLCGGMPSSSSALRPFPTAEMVDCLLKFGNFAPGRILEQLAAKDERQRWPGLGVISPKSQSNTISGPTRSRFIESQLSIIEAFSKYGLNRTGSVYDIPSDFVFQKEALLKTAEERLRLDLRDSLHMFSIIQTVEEVLKEEVRAHKKRKEQVSKKRKHCAKTETDTIAISDEVDDEDVIFLGERLVGGEKRIKVYEDDSEKGPRHL